MDSNQPSEKMKQKFKKFEYDKQRLQTDIEVFDNILGSIREPFLVDFYAKNFGSDWARPYYSGLEQTQWKVSGKNSAAEILGLNRSTLRARMRRFDIRKP